MKTQFSKRKKYSLMFLTAAGIACAAAAPPSCDANWGLGMITDMKTPVDPAFDCKQVKIPQYQNDLARKACSYGTGSSPSESLGISKQVLSNIPIRHVVILMKENRSFDHLLGKLAQTPGGQPDIEGVDPNFSNRDKAGIKVYPERAKTTCLFDPGHQSKSIKEGVNKGAMDGFVLNAAKTTTGITSKDPESDGHYVMSYYDSSQLPFYYFLAKTYAISDRHFSPLQAGTFANRNFFLFADNVGSQDTGLSIAPSETPSILQTLIDKGLTWGAYTDSQSAFSGALAWTPTTPGVHKYQDFLKDLDNGTLPNVSFVEGDDNVEDDHPTADLQVGEKWLKEVYDHAIKSPQWNRTAMFWTYDEGGGFADHVQPPKACSSFPKKSGKYSDLGIRVPLVAISPWAKRNYASHVETDHTAISRFIGTIFDLPALTARDANSDALLDMFDFSCGAEQTPIPEAPSEGTGGCVNQPPYTG